MTSIPPRFDGLEKTLNSLEILRPHPQKINRAYYYPPSQDPSESEIANWSSVRKVVEKSKCPSLTPMDQIGPCEQRVEAIEGYFKKVKQVDQNVES